MFGHLVRVRLLFSPESEGKRHTVDGWPEGISTLPYLACWFSYPFFSWCIMMWKFSSPEFVLSNPLTVNQQPTLLVTGPTLHNRSSVCLFPSVLGYANQLRKVYILKYQQARTVRFCLIAHTIYLIFQNLHVIERPISGVFSYAASTLAPALKACVLTCEIFTLGEL
jgi:hypothetical protein